MSDEQDVHSIIISFFAGQSADNSQYESNRFPENYEADNGQWFVLPHETRAQIRVLGNRWRQDPSLWRANTSAKQVNLKFSSRDWDRLIRNIFKKILAASTANGDANTVLDRVKSDLQVGFIGYGLQEFVFGCSLFHTNEFQHFAIGPVSFETRLDWLARKEKFGQVSTTSCRRIAQKWHSQKTNKRKPSRDQLKEDGIIEAIGDALVVCSVSTEGMASVMAHERALRAARLALTAIALRWQTPSKVLDGMNLLFDRQPRKQAYLVFDAVRLVSISEKYVHVSKTVFFEEKWDKIHTDHANYFSLIGEMLYSITNPVSPPQRPAIIAALTHAMMWFHEAARSDDALVATIKYAASLDALASGGRAEGIKKLINARLGILADRKIYQGGPTLNKFVNNMFDHVRSRTMHGTNPDIHYDLCETSATAEQLARLCLLLCIGWAVENPNSDDPKGFIGQ
jgi:hypothetical protein